jgi:hypothetical protein
VYWRTGGGHQQPAAGTPTGSAREAAGLSGLLVAERAYEQRAESVRSLRVGHMHLARPGSRLRLSAGGLGGNKTSTRRRIRRPFSAVPVRSTWSYTCRISQHLASAATPLLAMLMNFEKTSPGTDPFPPNEKTRFIHLHRIYFHC